MGTPRGVETRQSQHTVKTLAKAQEWWRFAEEEDLPIVVQQDKGEGGRLRISIYDKHKILRERRG